MSRAQIFAVIVLLLLSVKGMAREKHAVFITYGQSTFLFAPGITYMSRIGSERSVLSLYSGIGFYIQQIDFDRVINTTNQYRFNFQHIDIGFAYDFFYNDEWRFALMTGVKMHYGPHYLPVAFYQTTVYYDASGLRPAFGADLGITASYRRLTAGVKFDTARKHFRAGLGIRFGKGND